MNVKLVVLSEKFDMLAFPINYTGSVTCSMSKMFYANVVKPFVNIEWCNVN